MVRNVLEIMSFSRLNKNLVQNNRYAQRDISKADTQYMQKYNKENLCAGWLKEDKDGNWSIEKCKSFAFIDHKELKDKLGIPFRNLFLVTVEKGKPRKLLKTAKEKYDEAKKINVSLKQTFVEKKQTEFPFLDLAEISEQGKQGSLVFTGQAAARFEIPKKKANGKTREFVFFDDENPVVYSVPSEVQKDFRFIYNDHDAYSVSKDWKYFRDEFLQQGKKVPVFFSPGENHTVRHFGMAYMYKLPYDYNVHGLNPIKDYKTAPDLAHTIFGQAVKGESWKGRVFFGHAMADTSTVRIIETPVEEILATPKASYFPYYIEQFKKEGEYYTYDDEGATLRGFKRYPVRKEKTTGIYDEKQKQNKKTWSKFLPILEGGKFTGKIRFHNLKKEELGALLSALTFHDNGDLCYHSLGGAKPYGYGRISLKAKLKTLEKNWTYEECIQSFEEMMDKHIPNWINSKPITELFSIAILGDERTLGYATTKEYQNYKKRGQMEKLEQYSIISKSSPIIKKIKSAKVKFQPQEKLEIQFESYIDLQKTLNEKFDIFKEFNDDNKQIIYDYLIRIIKVERHKESIKKIRKSGHWDGNILKWLGPTLREKLKTETGLEIID